MLHLQESSAIRKRKFADEQIDQSNKRLCEPVTFSTDHLRQETSDISSSRLMVYSEQEWEDVLESLALCLQQYESECSAITSLRSDSPISDCSNTGKPPSDEVLIAQLFKRPPHQPLNLHFLLQVITQAFPDEAASWTQQIACLDSRSAFLERMCNCKMKDSKLHKTKNILFWMLRCVDHFAEQQTTGSTAGLTKSFDEEFQHSICRVLAHPDRQKDTFRRNPNLVQSLALSHQYLSYLLRFIQVDRNLGFYLLFVSCVEGRGVYHGRTSNFKNMSVPHKCYRYMIETMAGKRYADIPVDERLPYQQKLIEYFEGDISPFIRVSVQFPVRVVPMSHPSAY